MKSQKPIITTIIPTYRRPKLLKRAILSVLNQTYPNFQVCIYDNDPFKNETELMVTKLAKNDSRIKYYKHKKNIGGISNFNYGLTQVDTPFFSILCDDDILLPNFFKIAMKDFEEHPNAMLSISKTLIMNEKGFVSRVTLPNWGKEGYYVPPDGFIQCIENSLPFWGAMIYRRELIKKIGLIDPNIIEIDIDLILRIISKYPLVMSNEITTIALKHEGSYCETAGLTLIYPDFINICKKLYTDSGLPKSTKKKARILLNSMFKTMLLSMWWRGIRRKNFTDSHKIISITKKHYGNSFRLFIMNNILKAVESNKIIYKLFIWSSIILRNSIYKTNTLQKKYGKYAKYLTLYS